MGYKTRDNLYALIFPYTLALSNTSAIRTILG